MARKPKADEPLKVGRPTAYNDETTDAICVELMLGKSLVEICARDDMPAERTVYMWLLKYPEFVQKYARAREIQAERGVDEIIPIADDGSNDWMQRNYGEETHWVVNGEAIRRSQLRIDARKWKASKLRPKVYGEKASVEHSGPDGGAIPHVVERRIVNGSRD